MCRLNNFLKIKSNFDLKTHANNFFLIIIPICPHSALVCCKEWTLNCASLTRCIAELRGGWGSISSCEGTWPNVWIWASMDYGDKERRQSVCERVERGGGVRRVWVRANELSKWTAKLTLELKCWTVHRCFFQSCLPNEVTHKAKPSLEARQKVWEVSGTASSWPYMGKKKIATERKKQKTQPMCRHKLKSTSCSLLNGLRGWISEGHGKGHDWNQTDVILLSWTKKYMIINS